jgi:hypothetical protein
MPRSYLFIWKKSLLSYLPNDIIWNRAQLLWEIFRQKFVFALHSQICKINFFNKTVFGLIPLYATPIILILNESLRYNEQLYIYGTRKCHKRVMKRSNKYFWIKKIWPQLRKFSSAYCSKVCVAFRKLFQSNSLIYFFTRHLALSNKKGMKSLRHSIVLLHQKQNSCKTCNPPVISDRFYIDLWNIFNVDTARNSYLFPRCCSHTKIVNIDI